MLYMYMQTYTKARRLYRARTTNHRAIELVQQMAHNTQTSEEGENGVAHTQEKLNTIVRPME